ncbi:MAG: MFS transporter [Candidatus Paceibacterota bacterium]|jgi:MFS family permease
MINKIIRQYLVLTGMFNLAVSLSLGTYVSFLISRGLNLFEVNLVNVAYFVAMFFFEIPTGAFADTFGRKNSYVISCVLFSLGMIVYSQSYTMAGFIGAEILAGIGRTFGNGAYHAWFVDMLKHHGYKGTTAPVFRKEQMVRQFVSIPGAIAGGYIGSLDLSYPWLVGGCMGIVVALLAWFIMKEDYFVRPPRMSLSASVREMFRMAGQGMRFARKSKVVRLVVVMNALLAFAVQSPNMQWQPFFRSAVGNVAWFGYIWAGIATCIFIGIHASAWVRTRIRDEPLAMAVSMVAAGIMLVCAVLSREYVIMAIALFLAHEIPRGAYAPIKDAYLNDHTDQRERATVISCQSVFGHLACLSGLLLGGLAAEMVSISAAWLISGAILVAAPFIIIRVMR